MKNLIFFGIIFCFFNQLAFTQEITETNADSLYFFSLREYKAQNYERSLSFANRGLELAPEYHDIRILRIRDYWALNNLPAADEDLTYLLRVAPKYIDVKPIVYQRVSKFQDPKMGIQFIDRSLQVYPDDVKLQIQKAQFYLKDKNQKDARALALDLIAQSGISGEDRYVLQTILNRTITNEIGFNYQYINFSKEYSRTHPWNTISGEYQHNFNRTAVIGRATYSDRSYTSGTLYEIEAYPVFNDRFYAFANLGVSDGSIFPDVRTSLSLFYNIFKGIEAEAGGRMLFYNNSGYFTGIVGLTGYSGKFYLNGRTFIGPKRSGKLVQNYQANVRYYFQNADNYLFLRLGSGISPDERVLFSQVENNPTLDAYYGNFGINKTIGIHNIFQLGLGLLYEDITPSKQGTQVVLIAGYRYRF